MYNAKIYNMAGFRRFLGFTLAEVLITLGIIGIVASITIPVPQARASERQHEFSVN